MGYEVANFVGALKKSPKKLASSTKLTRTTLREDIGKLLLDVGKLVLAGIVIGGILRRDLPQDDLLTIGIAVVIVSFILGIIMGTKEIKTDKTIIRRRKRRKR